MAELLSTQIECETIAGRRKRLPHKTRQCFCSMWGSASACRFGRVPIARAPKPKRLSLAPQHDRRIDVSSTHGGDKTRGCGYARNK
jgi:hypothetical protein